MERHEADVLGSAKSWRGRFPLLVKILDAREKLSLQVHPPAAKAAELGGEPKTEMWYIADAEPGAELYVGLQRGVTRAEFEQKLRAGSVAECFHRIPVRVGDAMFLPSGRVHALGAGLVIFEIQQNSDTTYRVSDWGRLGLDGKPREVHVGQSLASIDFNDFAPELVRSQSRPDGVVRKRPLVRDPLFTVEAGSVATPACWGVEPGKMHLIGVLSGALEVTSPRSQIEIQPGQFCLIPAAVSQVKIRAGSAASYLQAEAGLG